ncbi:MAG: TMEM175 family protein [Chitinophagales bacterium]
MSETNLNEAPSTSRIEAFSDGVFAIVVTLLVLELKIPILGHQSTEEEATKSLMTLIPKFISWGMSFIIVAIFWVNHHQFMRLIKRSDQKFLWYNIHLLFWTSFIPFPTAFIGEYYGLKTAVILFAGVLFMASLAFFLMSKYAFFKGNLHKNMPLDVRTYALRRGLIAPGLYLIAIFSAFINPTVSIVIFFFVPVMYIMPLDLLNPEEIRKRREHKFHHHKHKKN